MAATKCRMCGRRNRVGTAVICVYAPDTTRQYYCFPCWDEISLRAAEDIPDLEKESEADAVMVGMLLGIKSMQKKDKIESGQRLEMRSDGTVSAGTDIDIRMPKSLIVDGVPFKRYHLTGDELEEHKRQIERTHSVDRE